MRLKSFFNLLQGTEKGEPAGGGLQGSSAAGGV